MADLARIKRNVAKMASMGAPEADIDGYIASEGVTVDDVKNFGRPQLSPMTDEQRAQAAEMAREIRPQRENVALAGLTGFGEGAKLFGENVLNGLTAGLYGAANRELGGDFKERNEQAGANKYANIAGDILGSVAGAGTAAYNLAGRAGLKGVARLAGAGALESGVRGASEGDTVGQAAYNVLPSALVGGVSGGALGLAGKAIKRLVPSLNVIGKKSGLENALDDVETLRAINRGSRASDDVAQTVLNRAGDAKGALNDEMAAALDRATGRKLNIQNTIDTQQKRLGQFVKQNENQVLFSELTPEQQAQQNFKRWFEGSQVVDENGQPLKLYHQTGADFDAFEKGLDSAGKYDYETPSGFFFKSNNADIGLQGKKQIPVYIKGKKGIFFKNRDEARKYFRENIDGYDDLLTKYNNVDNEYLAKEAQRESILDKRIDNLEKSPAYMKANEATQMKMREDVINSLDDDAFFNEWRDAGNKYASQMKNKINDYIKENNIDFMRIENDSGSIGKKATDAYIVFNPNQIKSVNNSGAWSSSPSLSDSSWKPTTPLSNYTQGLTDFQVDALNKALAEGASKSTTPLGTLGATHRGQEVLNDMIEASFDKSMIGTKRPTTDTKQLMELKERFNEILEPSGVKPFDESYSKAQALRTNFEKGYNFKPSETKFETLGLEKARDKRAFLQGRLSKILDNVTDDQNVATLIKKDQNTLKKLMPNSKFKALIDAADKAENKYRNIKNLETTATSALRRSSDAGRPLSELGETKSSMLGAALDRLFGGVYRAADANVANRILSGKPIPTYSNILNASRASVPSISSLLAQEVVKNQ